MLDAVVVALKSRSIPVREAIGPDIQLMIDSNHAYSLAEARANNVKADVMMASVADSLQGTGIPQKFWSPEFAAFDPQVIDPEGYWVSWRTT